jgi:hypothetical protein
MIVYLSVLRQALFSHLKISNVGQEGVRSGGVSRETRAGEAGEAHITRIVLVLVRVLGEGARLIFKMAPHPNVGTSNNLSELSQRIICILKMVISRDTRLG